MISKAYKPPPRFPLAERRALEDGYEPKWHPKNFSRSSGYEALRNEQPTTEDRHQNPPLLSLSPYKPLLPPLPEIFNFLHLFPFLTLAIEFALPSMTSTTVKEGATNFKWIFIDSFLWTGEDAIAKLGQGDHTWPD